eukprot:jgi/Chrpa1/989/Chrysochromulina_OHIO_Genome00000795-RA
MSPLSMSYGDDNNQTKLPPRTAITDQHLLARRFYEHMRSEGVKAGDEVLLVPAGVWVAEGGPLRPGLDALGAQLRDAGVSVKISKDQKYPSRDDSGRAFTAGLKPVLAQDLSPAVDAAALSDTLLNEQVAHEHADALMVMHAYSRKPRAATEQRWP